VQDLSPEIQIGARRGITNVISKRTLYENGQMETPRSFEAPVNFYGAALLHISENGTPHIHRSENLNLNKNNFYLYAELHSLHDYLFNNRFVSEINEHLR
jgi:hypothetical protein